MPTRADIIAAARGLIGTPYGLHGRVPGRLLDCAGVVVASLAACGIGLESRWDYPTQPGHDIADHWLRQFLRRTEIDSAAAGDVLQFDYRGFAHLGILTDDGIVTVRPAPRGTVYESPRPAPQRWRSAWVLPGVTDG